MTDLLWRVSSMLMVLSHREYLHSYHNNDNNKQQICISDSSLLFRFKSVVTHYQWRYIHTIPEYYYLLR